MTIFFRLDSSSQIGFGHLSRCLSFAKALVDSSSTFTSADVVFIVTDCEGNFNYKIEEQGYKTILLPSREIQSEADDAKLVLEKLSSDKAPILIVDHYKLGATFETLVRKKFEKIFVIDDKANRSHDCDYILDQNYRIGFEKAYDQLTPVHVLKYLGPKFAILRDEFLQTAPREIKDLKNVVVFFGGSDYTGETHRFLTTILTIHSQYFFHVVLTSGNKKFEEIKNLSYPHFKLHINPKKFSEIIHSCDFYLGSGGTVTWERMALGVPGAVLSVADNQEQVSYELSLGESPEQFYWGKAWDFDYAKIEEKLNEIKKAGIPQLQKMQSRNLQLIFPNQFNQVIQNILGFIKP